MKAARFFSICEIVCFVGLALSYAGEFLCAFVAQGTDKDKLCQMAYRYTIIFSIYCRAG